MKLFQQKTELFHLKMGYFYNSDLKKKKKRLNGIFVKIGDLIFPIAFFFFLITSLSADIQLNIFQTALSFLMLYPLLKALFGKHHP